MKKVISGYSGGNVPNPTYEEVSSGLTGHAEAFQVEFDPAVAPYEKLLKYFWASHDPTTPNQQGPDFGTQYRSVIFYHNEAQKTAAQKSYQEPDQQRCIPRCDLDPARPDDGVLPRRALPPELLPQAPKRQLLPDEPRAEDQEASAHEHQVGRSDTIDRPH